MLIFNIITKKILHYKSVDTKNKAFHLMLVNQIKCELYDTRNVKCTLLGI